MSGWVAELIQIISIFVLSLFFFLFSFFVCLSNECVFDDVPVNGGINEEVERTLPYQKSEMLTNVKGEGLWNIDDNSYSNE